MLAACEPLALPRVTSCCSTAGCSADAILAAHCDDDLGRVVVRGECGLPARPGGGVADRGLRLYSMWLLSSALLS